MWNLSNKDGLTFLVIQQMYKTQREIIIIIIKNFRKKFTHASLILEKVIDMAE